MVDLKILKNSLSSEEIIRVMTDLGSPDYEETEDCIKFRTICHNCDASHSSMKLWYYKDSKVFHCYTECCCNFDIYELMRKRYDLLGTPYSFYKDIVAKLGGDKEIYEEDTRLFEEKMTSVDEKYEYSPLSSSLLFSYVRYCPPEWLNDGISEESMTRYNILYSLQENQVIIPHYDTESNLIGIRGRPLDEEDVMMQGKYHPVMLEGCLYSHSLSHNLYGLNVVKRNIAAVKSVIIAEGEKSCLQYDSYCNDTENVCVAACGNHINPYQVKMLIEMGAERIILAFDQQGTTKKEQEQNAIRMMKICNKYSWLCEMGFLYDEHGLLRDKQSPFDGGIETLKRMKYLTNKEKSDIIRV